MGFVDGVILYSDSEIPMMTLRGVNPSKLFVAPNTIHVSNYSDGSSAYKDSFLFTGRAQKRKKIDTFIRAFSDVIDRIPSNTKINIVGSGEENHKLANLAKQFGISDRVIFHGEIVDDEKLKPFFHSAYAYVSPGPVGLGVLHSFAYGVPVVTDRSGRHGPEFDNLINNENSLLYNTYDEFKNILISLSNDHALSVRLGRNAYELYAHERTIEKMVEGFRQAIEGV